MVVPMQPRAQHSASLPPVETSKMVVPMQPRAQHGASLPPVETSKMVVPMQPRAQHSASLPLGETSKMQVVPMQPGAQHSASLLPGETSKMQVVPMQPGAQHSASLLPGETSKMQVVPMQPRAQHSASHLPGETSKMQVVPMQPGAQHSTSLPPVETSKMVVPMQPRAQHGASLSPVETSKMVVPMQPRAQHGASLPPVEMTFLEDRDFSDVPLIPEYFKGKTVFITGGSGFVGKALVEKLLYSCSQLDRIYLLLRSKRGVTPEDRLDSLYEQACFDRLRSEKPGLFKSKVFAISGDVQETNLGISDDDRALLVSRTNIIFHSAASVRFDEPLKIATQLNLLGTKRMINLARDVHNLECFIHVSTSYSNAHRKEIKETLYPPQADWRELIDIVCRMDDHRLQVLTPKFLGEMANTYVLTKHLAEHMVYEERGRLPIVIMRPSIVTSSLMEPVPGWLDNFNGPNGLIVAFGIGILRLFYFDARIRSDFVPADLVVRALIVGAWLRGTVKLDPKDDIPIYNTAAGGHFNLTPLPLIDVGCRIVQDIPLECALWTVSRRITASKLLFHLNIYFVQLAPALFLDLLLRLFSKKPRLIKIIRRIYIASLAVEDFTMKEWMFSIENLNKLRSAIKDGDRQWFDYKIENIDLEEYFTNGVICGKKILLNEKMENLPYAKAHLRRLSIMDKLLKLAVVGVLLWYIFSSNIVTNIVESISNL